MSAVVAVLVVPADGDPGGLLADGRLRATPPMVHRCIRETSALSDYDFERLALGQWSCVGARSDSNESALPLWWDGALVLDGWDRYVRVLLPRDGSDDRPISRFPSLDAILNGLRPTILEFNPWVSRAVLLARVDGRLVEVSP